MEGPWEQYAPAEAGPWDQYKAATKGTSPEIGLGEDLAKTAMSIPGRAIAALGGLPADLAHLYAPNQSDPNPLGSQAIGDKLGNYEAKTGPGHLLQTAGDFLPAIIGGPETLGAKLLTRVAAPAAVSEVGREVAGPYGALAGALVGAGGATAAARKFQEMAAARRAGSVLPTGEQLIETGGKQFDRARNMDVVVKPDFAQKTAANMRAALKDFDPEDANVKDVFRKIDRLERLGSQSDHFVAPPIPSDGRFYEIPLASVKERGALMDSPFITSDGKIIGTDGDHISLFNPQEQSSARALRSTSYKDESGRLATYVEAREGQVPTKAQIDTLKNLLAEPGARFGFSIRSGDKIDVLSGSRDASLQDFLKATGYKDHAVQMNEVELIRKQLSKLRMSADASTREAAKRAQEVLTKNQMALTAADAVSGDAPLYSKTMQDAVGNYGAGKRSAVVTGKQDLAVLNAGTAGSGANDDNALRQAMKQIARPINNTNVPAGKRLGFNNQEIDAARQAAMGTPIGNTARYLGKLAPTGSVSGVLSAGAGYGAAGPLGAVALPAAGYLAKKIGDLSTKRAVNGLDSLIRSRSPLAVQVAAQLPPQIVAQLSSKTQRLLQALALTAPPLRQKVSQPVGQPVGQ
jgi:hypothetical protein